MTETNTRRGRNSVPSILGKVPPQATDIEDNVLGVLMLNREAIFEVVESLKPEYFYTDANQNIYKAILILYRKGYPIDALSVSNELRTMGSLEMVGGMYVISGLVDRAIISKSLEYQTQVIAQKYLGREIIRTGSENVSNAYDDTNDPFEILQEMSKFLEDAENQVIGSSEKTMFELASDASKLQDITNPGEILGLTSGSSLLDKMINGLQGSQLYIIAGRPAMGKTAVLCSMVKHIGVDLDQPVAIFSLEMSALSLYRRLQANVSGIDSRKIASNNLTDEERQILVSADSKLIPSKIIIDDKPAITAFQIRNKCAIYKRRYGIKAVFIDYLQLMGGDGGRGGNREQEIANISRTLKLISKELDIPVICLAQLSREVEKRPGLKIPILADLRESGAIEQDADVVMFLWRPEYYGISEPTVFRKYHKTIENKDLLVYIIAKQRDGDVGNVPLLFHAPTMRIEDHPDVVSEFVLLDGPRFDEDKNLYNSRNKVSITENEENDLDDKPF